MEGMLSPADVAVLSGNTGNNSNGNSGFGDSYGAWWIIIFVLFFAFGGWGRNGFGGNGGSNGNSGVMDGYTLVSDFAQVDRKLDAIGNGICDSTFALNNTMTNGFANVQQTLCQGFSGVNTAITQNGYENRLATQGLSAQLANCCCDIRQQLADCCCTTQRGIDGINYNMAMNTNAIQNTLCNNTRDVIDGQVSSTRAILDAITANRIEDKNTQIQMQQNEINALRLSASQERQNAYLLDELRNGKCPVPAYYVPNPNCCYNPCGFNNGCGCGNNF